MRGSRDEAGLVGSMRHGLGFRTQGLAKALYVESGSYSLCQRQGRYVGDLSGLCQSCSVGA